MTTYITRDEAIQREIIEVLGEYAHEFDIDAIADQVITTTGEGVHHAYITDDEVDFWGTVAEYAY